MCLQRIEAYGSLAQLNRASDYGSEGYRFESYRSHSERAFTIKVSALFLYIICDTALSAYRL